MAISQYIISSRIQRFQEYIKNNQNGEQWEVIKDTQYRYYISSFGNVLSVCHKVPKILIPYESGKGYLTVKIDRKNRKIHRLVGDAFIENPDKLPVLHHIDNNKKNNHIENLTFVSYSDNTKFFYKSQRKQK